MVLRCQVQLWVAKRTARQTQPIEGLRAGNFVEELKVDIDEIWCAIASLLDYVITPDFLSQSQFFRHIHHSA